MSAFQIIDMMYLRGLGHFKVPGFKILKDVILNKLNLI